MREQYMLLQESHCLGFYQNRVQTVAQWLARQGLAVYNHMNDLMLDVIGLKNKRQPGPLNREQQQLFKLAVYDLDTFRNFLDRGEYRQKSGSGPQAVPGMDDEIELLHFGFRWIKDNLFK